MKAALLDSFLGAFVSFLGVTVALWEPRFWLWDDMFWLIWWFMSVALTAIFLVNRAA